MKQSSQGPASEREPRTASGSAHSGFAPGAATKRVLLAEDDADLRALIALKLTEAGFEVTEVADGTALLDRLADSIDVEGSLARFDSIVSDICMPGYTAIDILTGIRRYLPDTPVVLITGLADRHTHERAQQLGAVAVFDKPVDLDVLCTAVRNVISDRAEPT
ncbi:MAG TPA: response regulator [Polyangiaceae bacterium]|nr:response regulator [Polyangiaceae bacterium]